MTKSGGGRRGSELTRLDRANQVARMFVEGATRREVLQFASEKWGMAPRTTDRLIADARACLVADYSVDRRELMAQLLSSLSLIQMKALHQGDLSVALGAVNAIARLCGLFAPPPAPSVSYTSVNVNQPASPPPAGNWVRGLPSGEN
jgi:hypothetical protein